MEYDAILSAPFGALGVRCAGEALSGVDFLPAGTRAIRPRTALSAEVCGQLGAYLQNPQYSFALPLAPGGTVHQNKVWMALCAIPCGETLNYGELAARVGSSPRAVGQACGNNPIPIIIPCHRVLSKTGMGGFMHSVSSGALGIKQWLLAHEQR